MDVLPTVRRWNEKKKKTNEKKTKKIVLLNTTYEFNVNCECDYVFVEICGQTIEREKAGYRVTMYFYSTAKLKMLIWEDGVIWCKIDENDKRVAIFRFRVLFENFIIFFAIIEIKWKLS